MRRIKLSFGSLLYALMFILLLSCGDDDSPSENLQEEDPNAANLQGAGQSARDFLTAEEFTSLRIELAYPDGFRPTQQSIDAIIPFLEDRLNKPGGVIIVENQIISNETPPYTIEEIRSIEDANRTIYNEGDELGLWIFFSDGQAENDSGVNFTLGTAYRNTSLVIYEQTFFEIANQSQTGINIPIIETSTIRHEFGHLFGLVNLGTPLQSDHEDPNAAHHCIVEGCLMEASVMTSMFNTDNFEDIPNFDPLCIQDLQANGGL